MVLILVGNALGPRPVLLGRLMSQDERRGWRYGEHTRVGHRCVAAPRPRWRPLLLYSDIHAHVPWLRSGVLTCDEGWRFFGMTSAPQEKSGDKVAQGKISSFFGKKPAAATVPAEAAPISSPQKATVGNPDHSNPPTPGGGTLATGDVARYEDEVARLTAQRLEIAMLAGHVEGDPLLLSNLASPLANATRLLAVRRRAQRP